MKKEYLECGKILAPHGVRGLIKVEPYCDSPDVLTAQKRVFLADKDGYREVKVISATQNGASVLMQLEGIDNREYVQGMRGTLIYLKREDIALPEGRHFIADIIGLRVIDADTERVYGTVSDIQDSPRHKLYFVKTEDGKEVILPEVDEFIKEIDTERGVFIKPIPGFFD